MGFLDSIVQPVVSMISPAAGAALGQGQQNQANWDLAQSANQANQASADKQMQFQADQAATAHQREVKDLTAAGLNPILSGTGGAGAASGSGASANNVAPAYESPGKVGAEQLGKDLDRMVSLVGTVSTMGMQNAQKELYNAQTQKTLVDSGLSSAQTAKTRVDTDVARKGLPAADFTNQFYNNILKPAVNKIQQRFQHSASPERRKYENNERAIREFNAIKGGMR